MPSCHQREGVKYTADEGQVLQRHWTQRAERQYVRIKLGKDNEGRRQCGHACASMSLTLATSYVQFYRNNSAAT
jgi:hypothetical protein